MAKIPQYHEIPASQKMCPGLRWQNLKVVLKKFCLCMAQGIASREYRDAAGRNQSNRICTGSSLTVNSCLATGLRRKLGLVRDRRPETKHSGRKVCGHTSLTRLSHSTGSFPNSQCEGTCLTCMQTGLSWKLLSGRIYLASKSDSSPEFHRWQPEIHEQGSAASGATIRKSMAGAHAASANCYNEPVTETRLT